VPFFHAGFGLGHDIDQLFHFPLLVQQSFVHAGAGATLQFTPEGQNIPLPRHQRDPGIERLSQPGMQAVHQKNTLQEGFNSGCSPGRHRHQGKKRPPTRHGKRRSGRTGRQQKSATATGFAQKVESGHDIVPAVGQHCLQAVSEDGFHRPLKLRRHLQNLRHHVTKALAHFGVFQQGLNAPFIAFQVAFQFLQGFKAGTVSIEFFSLDQQAIFIFFQSSLEAAQSFLRDNLLFEKNVLFTQKTLQS